VAAKTVVLTGRAPFSKSFHRSSLRGGRAAHALLIERVAASLRHRGSVTGNAAWRFPASSASAHHAASMAVGTKTPWFPQVENFSQGATPARLMRWGGRVMRRRKVMRNLLLAVATGALLVAAVPASAQVYMGADPGGAGVQVGPFGFGVGPRYGYDRWRGDAYRGDAYYAYGADCPLVKERIVTADGRVIIRTHRSCR
jgi:hypothetical protein